MEKVKRLYVMVNNTRRGNGYVDYNLAVNKYNTAVKHNAGNNKVSLVVLTDKNTKVELLSNQSQEQIAA